MKKRLLASLLCLCMLVGLLPATALAAGAANCPGGESCTHVAAIGTTHFDTLAEAMTEANAAAEAVTIELRQDIDLGEGEVSLTVDAGKTITIDFQGHTVTGVTGSSKGLFTNLGTLTLKDSSGKTGGIICTGKSNSYAIVNGSKDANGTLTLEGIKVTCVGTGLRNMTGSTATITGCQFSGKAGIVNAGIIPAITDTNITTERVAVKTQGKEPAQTKIGRISGCELHGTDGYALQVMSLIETVENSTLTSGDRAVIQLSAAGNTSNPTLASLKNTTVTASKGDAILLYGGAQLTIESGNYQGAQGKLAIKDGASADAPVTVTISGGTFSSDVRGYVSDGYVQDESGSVVVLTESTAVAKTTDGTIYATLAKAVAAAKDGDTVTLLRNAEHNARINIDKNLTLDLGGKTLTSNTSHSFVVYAGKSFTVQNGTMKNAEGAAIFGLKGSTITLAQDAALDVYDGIIATNSKADEGNATVNIYGTIKSADVAIWSQGPKNTFNLDGANITSNYFGVYQNGSFGGNTFHIKNSTITDTKFDGIYISNSKNNADNIAQGYQTLTIENSVITGPTAIETKYTNVTISGENSEIIATASPVDLTLNNNGSVTTGYALAITHNGTDKTTDAAAGTITVENGKFTGVVGIQLPSDGQQTAAVMAIKNGHFTTAPDAAYLAEGKTLVESSEAGYNWTVADKADTAAEVLPAAPEAETDLPEGASDEDQALADSVLAALTEGDTSPAVDANAMNAGASAIANQNTTTETEGEAKLEAAGITVGEDETVTIVVQPYLDIKITGADADGAANMLTLDITPMYQKVATTADLEQDEDITVNEEGVDDPNAVVLASGRLTVSEPVTVTIPLPESFDATDDAKIGHKGYVYTGKIDANHVLTFVNPHGFSAFTIGVTVAAENETTGQAYTDLQQALDEAENGQTVIVKTAPETGKTFTMSGDSRTITMENGTGIELTITINGEAYTVSAGASATVTYTRPSSGGGSSSSSYAVSVADSKNGTVTASHKSAFRNTTVTLTVRPDEGYKLASLTVTDKNGDEIKLTEKGDGKFTFTMPGSKVTVEASFQLIETRPEAPVFADVPADAWYADAVRYVYEKGLMLGVSGDSFAPELTTDRAMIATLLWRMEGSPVVNYAMDFSDVDPAAWYGEAVRWAASEGVVGGYGNGKFGPGDPITREQLATMLWRYAGSPAVSGMALNEFGDSASVSGYAVDAMRWAVSTGIIGGSDAGMLMPQGSATRAQAAAMLMRFAEALDN